MTFVNAKLFAVWVKVTANSPWHDTGIIESNEATANKVWPSILRKNHDYAYQLREIEK